MKEKDLKRYYLLKNKKKLSTDEFFEFDRLSFEKRKSDFEKEIIPFFIDFAQKFEFELSSSFKELSRIFLKREDLEIFFIEEYQPRKMYVISFNFLIGEERESFNFSYFETKKELDIDFELNCVKETDLSKALLFIEKNLFIDAEKSLETKKIYDKVIRAKMEYDNRERQKNEN